ncbi:MAG: hypothetical protein WAP23_04050 [Candidatus Spechtbacterales bacterium]
MVSKSRQSKNARPQERSKQAQDYGQKLLDIARVARVTAGGRRFSFRAVVVVGDRAGKVGVGVRKGKDVRFAVEKAVYDAKKTMIQVSITEKGTIPHEVRGKSGSSVVYLKPAKEGVGIRAGGAVRSVCDLAGFKDIVAKILSRSGNKLNNARAAIEALKKIKTSKKLSARGLLAGPLRRSFSEASRQADQPLAGETVGGIVGGNPKSFPKIRKKKENAGTSTTKAKTKNP